MIDRIYPTSVYGADPNDIKAASKNIQDEGKLPFLFEIQSGKNEMLYEFVLPLSPENYDFQWQPRASVTMTQGGVFQDIIGIAPAKISINGTFGYLGTTMVGCSAKSVRGNSYGFTALDMYLEMESMFLDFYMMYGAMSGSSEFKGKSIENGKDLPFNKYEKVMKDKGNKGRILFFNFTDRHYYEVQIDNFKLTRSTQRKHLYQYALQMTCLQSIDSATANAMKETAKDANNLQLSDARTAAAKVSKFAAFMKKMYGAAYAVTATVQELSAQMDQISTAVSMFKNTATSLVHAPFDLVMRAKQNLESIVASIVAIGNLPHEFLNDMRELNRIMDNYGKNKDLFVSPTTGAAATPTLPPDNEVLSVPMTNMLLAAGMAYPGIPEENLYALAETAKLTAAKQITTNDGDTIYTIAQKTGVDWKQIALINNLEAPYNLTGGATLLVPSTSTTQTSVTANTQQDFEIRTFYADEMLDEDGFMVAENGGIKTVQGTDNLKMQLKHRLATQRGELSELGHSDYGCNMPLYVGRPNSDIWVRRALLEFRTAVQEDSRVDSVSGVKTTVDGTQIYMEGDVYPIGQTSAVDVSLPFV